MRTKKKKKRKDQSPSGESPEMTEVDGVKIGESPRGVPGMKLRCVCRGHEQGIGRLDWSPCGQFIASPSFDGTVRIWDTSLGENIATLNEHGGKKVNSVSWSASDPNIVASAARDGRIVLWDKETSMTKRVIKGSIDRICSVAFSPDGRYIASGAGETPIRIWETSSGHQLNPFEGHTDEVNMVLWSKDSKRLASAADDHTVRVWSIDEGEPSRSFSGHTEEVLGLAWLGDEQLVSCSTDRKILIWDLSKKNNPPRELEGHNNAVTSISISVCGKYIASKSKDHFVHIRETKYWNIIAKLRETASDQWPPSIAFHPSELVLATLGAGDRLIRIWDLDERKLHPKMSLENAREIASAKIVLVGDSNVGKSCLATRIAEDRWLDPDEQRTTHGMQFCPMSADELHPSAQPADGEQWELVLWDFGGQDEYKLIHQMFLHDTTLALVVIDPTRGKNDEFDKARAWNKRLTNHLRSKEALKNTSWRKS